MFLSRDEVRSAAFARALPFGAFIAVLAIRGGLSDWSLAPGVMDLRWLYGVQAMVACLALLVLSRRYKELAGALCLAALPLMASVGVGAIVLAIWIAPIPALGQLGAPSASFVPVGADGALRWDLIAMRTLGAVVVVPVMEELFWRSFLMRWIDKRDFLALPPAAVSGFAIVTSSAVFALAHTLWLPGLLAGLAYAHLYRRTGNLWYPIVAHATTNGMLALWVVSQRAWSYW